MVKSACADLHTIVDYVPMKEYIPLLLMGVMYTYDINNIQPFLRPRAKAKLGDTLPGETWKAKQTSG